MENIEMKLVPYMDNTVDLKANEALNVYINAINNFIPPGVNLINAPNTWANKITGKGITIAVIDTGCQTNHSDLVGQIIGGRNFTQEDNGKKEIYEDYNGHGTHVCGIIAAKAGNTGVTGVAPDAKLLILKVLDKNGSGNPQNLVDAINYAISKKVDIISMSLGMPSDVEKLHEAIKSAVNNNILVVCAAGNEGDGNAKTDEFDYPASYNEVISVGAIDNSENAASFTNSNKEVDLVAPGVGIVSTYIGNSYKSLSGTSMATPHVSGALALLKQWANKEFSKNMSEAELYAQLIKNTNELNASRKIQGNGMLHLNLKNEI